MVTQTSEVGFLPIEKTKEDTESKKHKVKTNVPGHNLSSTVTSNSDKDTSPSSSTLSQQVKSTSIHNNNVRQRVESYKAPATKKDSRKLFVGGLAWNGKYSNGSMTKIYKQ